MDGDNSQPNKEPECEHEWVVEHHNNGVGHHWVEMECKHCNAEPTDDEVEDATTNPEE
tara:strand:- start:222 stop:395 length:174 start_codon:yes stop_codon:yes gene_type:complete